MYALHRLKQTGNVMHRQEQPHGRVRILLAFAPVAVQRRDKFFQLPLMPAPDADVMRHQIQRVLGERGDIGRGLIEVNANPAR